MIAATTASTFTGSIRLSSFLKAVDKPYRHQAKPLYGGDAEARDATTTSIRPAHPSAVRDRRQKPI